MVTPARESEGRRRRLETTATARDLAVSRRREPTFCAFMTPCQAPRIPPTPSTTCIRFETLSFFMMLRR
jgi:hypothetical protein